MRQQLHAHKYLRIKIGNRGYQVFKCVLSGCPHSIRPELVIGYRAICWRCGKEITMTQWTAQFKKPHCRECTKEREEKAQEAQV